MWPSEKVLPDVEDFKKTSLEYYYQVVDLAKDILKVLAQTLDLEESWFDEFAEGAVATMRLLHCAYDQGTKRLSPAVINVRHISTSIAC